MMKSYTFYGLKFIMTCPMCPEQYDVVDSSGTQVGYVRLRHGWLSCSVPDCGDKLIYMHIFNKSLYAQWKGCFDDEKETVKYLKRIAGKIKKEIEKETTNGE
ncbi:MAG: hypothetical protein AB7F40_04525 [Victivallaceae bacterium]